MVAGTPHRAINHRDRGESKTFVEDTSIPRSIGVWDAGTEGAEPIPLNMRLSLSRGTPQFPDVPGRCQRGATGSWRRPVPHGTASLHRSHPLSGHRRAAPALAALLLLFASLAVAWFVLPGVRACPSFTCGREFDPGGVERLRNSGLHPHPDARHGVRHLVGRSAARSCVRAGAYVDVRRLRVHGAGVRRRALASNPCYRTGADRGLLEPWSERGDRGTLRDGVGTRRSSGSRSDPADRCGDAPRLGRVLAGSLTRPARRCRAADALGRD